MTTIAQLYNNIKTLVLQVFEDKEDEDTNLPLEVENLFSYHIGNVYVYPLIISNFSNWSGSNPIYSNFILPYNHEVFLTFKSTPSVQFACSDTSDNWIYAQNIGYSNTKTLSYRNSSNGVVTKNLDFTLSSSSVYRIVCKNNLISFYVDDVLINSQQTYDTLNISRNIRIYGTNNVNRLTIRKVRV